MAEEIYTKKLFLENEVRTGFGFIQLDDDTLYFIDEQNNIIAYFSPQSGFAFTNSDSGFKLQHIGLADFTDDRVITWRNKSGSPALLEEVVLKGVENTTTLPLNSTELDALYPSVSIGFKVYCDNINNVYEKSPNGWISYSYVIV